MSTNPSPSPSRVLGKGDLIDVLPYSIAFL